MWILLTAHADRAEVQARLQALGLWTRALSGGETRGFEVLPDSRAVDPERVRALPGVAAVLRAASSHPKVDAQSARRLFLAGRELGREPLLFAGPCSVESRQQIDEAAEIVARCGATLLRGGAFKPRTSPYSFTGHGRPALGWMREAADRHGLGVVTEVMGENDVDAVAEVADLLQIGSRNMQNFALLAAVGEAGKPVLLKRGMAASVSEWLLAGEHLLAAGAAFVVFCERGIKGFDPQTRNLLDLGAVALLKHVHRQPVVVDPSHATGRRDLIPPLARAALALDADGLLIEAHPHAECARCDGPQALTEAELLSLGFAPAPGTSGRLPALAAG